MRIIDSDVFVFVLTAILRLLPKHTLARTLVYLESLNRFTTLLHLMPLTRMRSVDVVNYSKALGLNFWVLKNTTLYNARQFISVCFQRLCELMQISSKFTCTYNGKIDFRVRNFKQTFTAMLQCPFNNDHP